MDNASIPTLTLPLDTLIPLSFLLLLGFYIIFSIILHYHWKAYAADNKISSVTLLLYFTTTLPLLLVMGILTLII